MCDHRDLYEKDYEPTCCVAGDSSYEEKEKKKQTWKDYDYEEEEKKARERIKKEEKGKNRFEYLFVKFMNEMLDMYQENDDERRGFSEAALQTLESLQSYDSEILDLIRIFRNRI